MHQLIKEPADHSEILQEGNRDRACAALKYQRSFT
jgi:hypothetical protein